MIRSQFVRRTCAFALLALGCASAAIAQPILGVGGPLQANDRIAFCGDSITEQKNYTCVLQGYLMCTQPAANLQTCNFGWGGETTWGFKTRMKTDVLWFNPTVATVSYGMNDGGYGPVDPKRLADYNESTKNIIAQLKAAGVRQIVLLGPGCVDSDAFHAGNGAHDAALYNKTLSTFNDAARDCAKAEGVAFADVWNVMNNAMTKFKAKYPDRSFVGGDGIHPENVGHTVMAYAVLKALGIKGDVGTITIDLSAMVASGSDGQKILSFNKGALEIESSTYPYPITRNMDPLSLGSALDLVPFNEDLNRYMLIAKNGSAAKYKVTFGNATKTFSSEELAMGINLQDAFNESPFGAAFGVVDGSIHAQQDFEIPMMKQLIHGQEEWIKLAPEDEKTWRDLATQSTKLDGLIRTRTIKSFKPVKHTIKIEAE